MPKTVKAFTLLEMLVVIGIIAVLTGLGAVSYGTAQKKSRDAKRKSDLRVIQNAMEQYYSICGFVYPTAIASSIECPRITPTVAVLPTVPVDPKSATPYPTASVGTSGYEICTYSLESESPTGYCLKNQQ